jgi:hypothetical protein
LQQGVVTQLQFLQSMETVEEEGHEFRWDGCEPERAVSRPEGVGMSLTEWNLWCCRPASDLPRRWDKFDSTRAEILLSDKSRVRRDRRPENECLQIAGTNELMIFSCSNFSKLWIKQTIIKKLIQKKFPGRLGRKWLWHDRVGLIRIVKLTHGSWCLMHRSFYTLAPQRSLQPLIRKSSLPSCQWYRAV